MGAVHLPATPANGFRNPRYYAPEPVLDVLRGIVGAPELALIVDVDTLERSALAKVDRVMSLALTALARTGVHVILVARDEQDRAAMLRRVIAGSVWMPKHTALVTELRLYLPGARLIAISDDSHLLGGLSDGDRGIALGHPELASASVAVAGDTAVRATLWWLAEERTAR
jgi:hypothetical protein